MRSFASLRMTTVVPVASMLAIQVIVSFSVLALGVMMPAVARDLAIDPKLIGIFTAIIYGVAVVAALVILCDPKVAVAPTLPKVPTS